MKHSVHFNNQDNTWDNALPMGNGCFGGMIYHEDNVLHMFMNHYEVYHFVRKNVLPDDIRKGYKPPKEKGLAYQRYCKQADANQPKDGEPFCYYREDAAEAFDPEPYAEASFYSSNPSTGELQFFFDECLSDSEEALTLFVEDAKIDFSLQNSESDLNISTITSRKDCIINKVHQSRPGLLKHIGICMASYRGQDPIDITYQQIDSSTFAYTVSRIPDKAEVPFIFSGIVKLVGTTGKLIPDGQNADILLDSASCNFHVLSGVFTQWRYQDPLCVGLEYMCDCADSLDTLYQDHQAYWKQFFEQSSIDLPDKFLEHVYYVNQYALDCCSGKDGIMKHHACGLNGLWDIRRPCLVYGTGISTSRPLLPVCFPATVWILPKCSPMVFFPTKNWLKIMHGMPTICPVLQLIILISLIFVFGPGVPSTCGSCTNTVWTRSICAMTPTRCS